MENTKIVALIIELYTQKTIKYQMNESKSMRLLPMNYMTQIFIIICIE
jgi:hypothetical protein